MKDLVKDKDFVAGRVNVRLQPGSERSDFVSPILR